MNVIYEQEDCLNYDGSDKPQMEIVRLHKGETGIFNTECHAIYFFLEGSVRLTGRNFSSCEFFRLQVLFLPAEECYSYETLRDAEILVIRLLEPAKLCDSFRVETLYDIRYQNTEKIDSTEERGFRVMDIHPALRDFLHGIHRSLIDGVRCRRYFELNVELLFILLRCYYPKHKLYEFLYTVLSGDVVFSEYIRLRWMNFRSVKELAASMHLSPNHFTRKFTGVFGQSPYKWMSSARAKAVYNDLVYTEKNLKQMASDNGFSSMSMFTQFIKRELGKTPTEIRTGQLKSGRGSQKNKK